MKKTSLLILGSILLLIPLAVSAQAQMNQGLQEFLGQTNMGNVSLPTAIGRIVRIVISFLGLIAVVIVIIGGFKWMTSGGNEEAVGKAKKLMVSGLIGLAIIILAYAVAVFVINALADIVR